MSKEQIEEMADVYESARLKARETLGSMNEGECMWYAKAFYNAGYRKQSEGEWVLEREPNGKPYCFHCSVCDGDFHHIEIRVATKFCPHCGAKMGGE